jgi:hypothetical protein
MKQESFYTRAELLALIEDPENLLAVALAVDWIRIGDIDLDGESTFVQKGRIPTARFPGRNDLFRLSFWSDASGRHGAIFMTQFPSKLEFGIFDALMRTSFEGNIILGGDLGDEQAEHYAYVLTDKGVYSLHLNNVRSCFFSLDDEDVPQVQAFGYHNGIGVVVKGVLHNMCPGCDDWTEGTADTLCGVCEITYGRLVGPEGLPPDLRRPDESVSDVALVDDVAIIEPELPADAKPPVAISGTPEMTDGLADSTDAVFDVHDVVATPADEPAAPAVFAGGGCSGDMAFDAKHRLP